MKSRFASQVQSEVDAFTTSLAPINQTQEIKFSVRDRICCVSLLAMLMTLLRMLLAK
jgi:hypothetical protein